MLLIDILRVKICSTILQVNTLAAEKLYALAGDWAGLGPDTLLFDVCCGTGTIGLTLAHRVGMVMTSPVIKNLHWTKIGFIVLNNDSNISLTIMIIYSSAMG